MPKLEHVLWPRPNGYYMVFAYDPEAKRAYAYVVQDPIAGQEKGDRRFYVANTENDPITAERFNRLTWMEAEKGASAEDAWNRVNKAE